MYYALYQQLNNLKQSINLKCQQMLNKAGERTLLLIKEYLDTNQRNDQEFQEKIQQMVKAKLNKIKQQYVSSYPWFIEKEENQLKMLCDIENQILTDLPQTILKQLQHNITQNIHLNSKKIKKKGDLKRLEPQSYYLLNQWFYDNINYPYPTMKEKILLAQQANTTVEKVNNWFYNKRGRMINKPFLTKK